MDPASWLVLTEILIFNLIWRTNHEAGRMLEMNMKLSAGADKWKETARCGLFDDQKNSENFLKCNFIFPLFKFQIFILYSKYFTGEFFQSLLSGSSPEVA